MNGVDQERHHVGTTLLADEIEVLQGIAQELKSTRSGVTRAMVRYVLDLHRADFVQWIGETRAWEAES